jgi:hypothetical protein
LRYQKRNGTRSEHRQPRSTTRCVRARGFAAMSNFVAYPCL